MNTLIDKDISKSQLSNLDQIHIDEPSNNNSFFSRFMRWLHLIKRWKNEYTPENSENGPDSSTLPRVLRTHIHNRLTVYKHLYARYDAYYMKHALVGRLVVGNNDSNRKNEVMCINDIPFVIPRQLEDVRKQTATTSTTDFERAKLIIRRMDEYLVSPEDQNEAKRQRHQDTSVGLLAIAAAANTIQKVSFREVLSVDETTTASARRLSETNESVNHLSSQPEKIDAITDFQEAHDLIEFDEELIKHRQNLCKKETNKPSDMLYLKFCLMIELQRDADESCLRILLHDIIFKFHLSDFRLRCEIRVKKPIEHELVLEKIVRESHLTKKYSAEFILWSGDWIAQQEVELYIVMKVESLSINKYISSKFWDVAHLYVKNVPHGASRIFLRELTPVSRPYKILSRGINVGQVEIEAAHWPARRQLSIHIVKVSHSQAQRLLRTPETYVEVLFQGPFNIFDIKRTKVADRSLNPKFDEEFLFEIPDKTAVSDVTVDLIFLERSSLYHRSAVLGVLTLSKHTDWFPVRKFWAELEENPNIKIKNSFLFEGNVDE